MNSVTPLAVTPEPRPCTPRGWLSSFDVHCSSKPGADNACTEILSSVGTHDVRCASASAVSHCEPPRPTCANARLPASTHVAPAIITRWARITFLRLPSDAKAIEETIERRDIDAAVGDGQPAEMVPRLDRAAARPQFLPGLRVEGIQGGAARRRNATPRPRAQSAAVDGPSGLVPRLVGHHLR